MAEGKNEDTKKKVMVAIDESDCSHYAFTWALDRLGPTLQNSHLLIFTAQPILQFGYAYASSYGATRMFCIPLFLLLLLKFWFCFSFSRKIDFKWSLMKKSCWMIFQLCWFLTSLRNGLPNFCIQLLIWLELSKRKKGRLHWPC